MKFAVTLDDGRILEVHSDSDDKGLILGQAEHAEWSRYDIAVRRGQDVTKPSKPVSLQKVKD